MKPWLIRPLARLDLVNIRAYTIRLWGTQQARNYLYEMELSFRRIGLSPERGQTFQTPEGRYQRVKCGSHYIFYRNMSDRIAIVRILHEKMDFERHLAGII